MVQTSRPPPCKENIERHFAAYVETPGLLTRQASEPVAILTDDPSIPQPRGALLIDLAYSLSPRLGSPPFGLL